MPHARLLLTPAPFAYPFPPALVDTGGGLRSSSTETPHDIFSFSHVRNATRLHDDRLGALRHLSTSGQGLRATVDEQLDRWNAGAEDRPLVGRMGLGLPLSNVYATYFGAYQAVDRRLVVLFARRLALQRRELRLSLDRWIA